MDLHRQFECKKKRFNHRHLQVDSKVFGNFMNKGVSLKSCKSVAEL